MWLEILAGGHHVIFRVSQHGINGSQLLLNLGLCASFRHLFAPFTLTIAFEFIHFALRQLQNSPRRLLSTITQYVRIIYLMLNGNELQDVLGQYSRSALSLDDDFLLAWEIPPRWGGIWRD